MDPNLDTPDDYDPEYERQQDLKAHVKPLTDEEISEDEDGCTVVDPRTGTRYMVCNSCGMIMDHVEDHHSGGECNLCHAVNKDD